MADDKRDVPRPFDVRTVEYLLKLMSEHDLAEIDLKEGDQRIRLRKGSAIPAYYPAPLAVSQPVSPVGGAAVSANSTSAPSSNEPKAPSTSTPTKKLIEIKSEMVGTFYTKPDPKKPDFVSLGSKVTPKTVVCTIEAMKIYNEIVAGCSGTIVEICKSSGEYVQYGDVLFRVDPG